MSLQHSPGLESTIRTSGAFLRGSRTSHPDTNRPVVSYRQFCWESVSVYCTGGCWHRTAHGTQCASTQIEVLSAEMRISSQNTEIPNWYIYRRLTLFSSRVYQRKEVFFTGVSWKEDKYERHSQRAWEEEQCHVFISTDMCLSIHSRNSEICCLVLLLRSTYLHEKILKFNIYYSEQEHT